MESPLQVRNQMVVTLRRFEIPLLLGHGVMGNRNRSVRWSDVGVGVGG